MTLTWEAFRLTTKSPTEVLHVLGPHGVDDLIRKAMDACWREYPQEQRSYDAVKKRMLEVYQRNMKHWASIKKPTPAAFFERLLPYTADGHMRQALVLAWMMMPRAGGRDFKDVRKIIEQIFQRNLEAWDQDHRTFTGAKKPARKPPAKPKKKPGFKPRPAAVRKPAARAPGRRSTPRAKSRRARR